jgi:hypothetical protein
MTAPPPGHVGRSAWPWNNFAAGLEIREFRKSKGTTADGTGPALNLGLHCLKKRGPSLRKFPVCLRLLFELSLDLGIYFVNRQPFELLRVLKVLRKFLRGPPACRRKCLLGSIPGK